MNRLIFSPQGFQFFPLSFLLDVQTEGGTNVRGLILLSSKLMVSSKFITTIIAIHYVFLQVLIRMEFQCGNRRDLLNSSNTTADLVLLFVIII